jgi:hypothetical protein
MITRAQAEALLTLAESLEACGRVGVKAGAWMAQGLGLIDIKLDGSDEGLDTTITGEMIRHFVADRLPKHTGS